MFAVFQLTVKLIKPGENKNAVATLGLTLRTDWFGTSKKQMNQ